mmetsp:Transcript_15867/g.20135  ORF Transcript_15867/g.20135 Transcript_15867/m.20135 type:complete len:321 (-) Transcript_15867:84-1046(-)|eukprot:CAMPEP_0203665754 /NCGR_PEP_ID=MMETSP0090-20130426/2922_1 /ASSEMBLY_ACC=CAM_ASM_001088 /TAXON_ID=426623 /ORGANISM="Chaetoceros affinis, Strain CCMP159" /LENGTH=320 /DNA_ID=CAMNT_0050529419 /DNA_START=12 /DNA_END=974 /DNA_ORIENTATION=-
MLAPDQNQNETMNPSSLSNGGDTDSNMDTGADQQMSILSMLRADPPPDPLPDGWIMHRSRSQAGYAYYFNQFTGECKWDPPYSYNPAVAKLSQLEEGLKETLASLNRGTSGSANTSESGSNDVNGANSNKPSVKSILKSSTNNAPEGESGADAADNATPSPAPSSSTSSHKSKRSPRGEHQERERSTKRQRPSSSSSNAPEKVRALHILKKHRDSRRPSSWRQSKITISKREAVEELKELITILQDVEGDGDPKELRATFEELAKTESDCTSAKRGGDLGFFGRKKMQPNFEKASFALRVGEMSGVVETSSGVHVILRLA